MPRGTKVATRKYVNRRIFPVLFGEPPIPPETGAHNDKRLPELCGNVRDAGVYTHNASAVLDERHHFLQGRLSGNNLCRNVLGHTYRFFSVGCTAAYY